MDQPVKARILLDGGSQRSYITHALDKLRLKKQRSENLNLNTFGNDRFTRKRCDVVTFDICCNGEVTPVHALSYPNICCPLNSHVKVERYPHLDGLDLADGNDRDSIDILIGSDFYWDIVTGEVIKGDTGPVALGSKLGWILSGRAGESSRQSCVTNLLIEEPVINNNQNGGGEVSDSRENDELVQQLKRFWEVESFGIDNDTDTEGRTFLPEICFDTHLQRYEVKLPWNNSNEASSSLYDTCRARLFQLRSRLQKDPKLFEEYDKIIHQQKEQGIIEEVSDMKCEEANFLPHHGVVRSDKETTKLRIVYDGSAKDRNSASLNDMLETGPNLTPHIFDILIKFKTYQIGLTADIEKAFHQISIHPDDRRKLRFLWFDNFKDTKDPKVKQYQFCRLVFGLTSSPAILNSTIRFHLNHYISQSEELVKLLKQSVYVDDLVSGARTATEAVHIYKETNTIMKEGGFHFRKWKSNDMMVKQSFQPAESIDDKSEVKVLGTVWNSNGDTLMVDLQDVIEYGLQLPLTKRSILKLSAKVFDPLGLLTPFTVHFKIVFQQLCHEGVEWDEPLDGKLKRWWSSLFDDLHCLTSVHIPRCYFDKEKPVLCHQLHGFCDASQDAFAAVVYLRTEYDSGEVDVQIIASKTRVSPMKKQTIPRLELLGATLLARLMKTISTAFQSVGFFVKERWYWTDSFTALCWIKNSRQWKQYVQHRVDEIRGTSAVDGWRFCPGTLNIADLPSRSCSGKQLLNNQSWWNGPEFLSENKCAWPDIATRWESEIADGEQLKIPKVIVHSLSVLDREGTTGVDTVIDIERYSSKMKLLRVTCLVMKFIKLLKGVTNRRTIDAADMRSAEVCWVKAVQHTSFKIQLQGLQDERESSMSHNGLSLLLKDGIISCWNRIGKSGVPETAKSPILLPSNHRFTDLVVQEHHQQSLHSGVRQTLDSLRQHFWIPKGRTVVKRVLRKCTVCRRYEGRPYRNPQLSELPEFRVSDQPPFSCAEVDYAGPLILNNDDKAYVCLFTCASTRAVHLELCPDLSAKTFLEAFRRFVGRRGLPYKLVSDNAKTFKRGSNDIGKILSAPRTNNFLTNHQVSWEFIVEKAPWWGGFWERMVQLLKRCLSKAVGRTSLSFEELRTLLVEIESTINNRPITYVYGGEEEVCHALTPSDLIYGRRIASTSNDSHCDTVSTYNTLTRRMKHHFRLLANFANSWKREYLLSLQEYNLKQKSTNTSKFNLSTGDIVIIKDEQSARCFWKLGKVVETFTGRDGLCRAANFQVLSSTSAKKPTVVRRALRQLVPIEVKTEVVTK